MLYRPTRPPPFPYCWSDDPHNKRKGGRDEDETAREERERSEKKRSIFCVCTYAVRAYVCACVRGIGVIVAGGQQPKVQREYGAKTQVCHYLRENGKWGP